MVHEISTIVLKNQIVNFRKASLIIDKEHPDLYTPDYWNVKVYKSYNFEHYEQSLLNQEKFDIKIETEDGSSYSGKVAVGGLIENEIFFIGKGILVKE